MSAKYYSGDKVRVFNVTFSNISVISWLSVLLVKETGALGEKKKRLYNIIPRLKLK